MSRVDFFGNSDHTSAETQGKQKGETLESGLKKKPQLFDQFRRLEFYIGFPLTESPVGWNPKTNNNARKRRTADCYPQKEWSEPAMLLHKTIHFWKAQTTLNSPAHHDEPIDSKIHERCDFGIAIPAWDPVSLHEGET